MDSHGLETKECARTWRLWHWYSQGPNNPDINNVSMHSSAEGVSETMGGSSVRLSCNEHNTPSYSKQSTTASIEKPDINEWTWI